MQSFKKKIVSLIENGTDPLKVGLHNFNNFDVDVELLAIDRMRTCIGCEFYVDEPISFLRVEDVNVPELSNKMCNSCGCILSYKLRQSIKKCDKWLD